MSEVSEDFIEQAWSREQEPLAQLVTLYSDALGEPIRATDWQGGITSAGIAYPHYPFSLAWAGASKSNPFGGARLTIANADRQIEEAADASNDMVEIDLSLVRVEAPDVIEKAIAGARIPSIEGDAGKVQATIRPRDFSQEPACAPKYLPATTPGLF